MALLGLTVPLFALIIGPLQPALPAGASLGAPTLAGPRDGQTLDSFGPLLTWTNPAGTTQVHLQLIPAQNDGPGVDLILDAATAFQVPPPPRWYGLLPDITYTWRVRASDAATPAEAGHLSWGPWAETAFRTRPVSSASISPLAPADGAGVEGRMPVLQWANSDPNVWYYEVQVSRDPDFGTGHFLYSELRHGGVAEPPNSYRVPDAWPLETAVRYFWRVRPRAQGDAKPLPWSRTFSFTVSPVIESSIPVDLTRLPLGDGKVSSAPVRGSIWSCQSSFSGGGAFRPGPWLNSDGTFNYERKVQVDGTVSWPHQFSISIEGEKRVLSGNGLPDHTTGTYPVGSRDDAYQYDPNPNSIRSQSVRVELPKTPSLAAAPSCAGGAIGVLTTGSSLFNGLDAAGRDAVAHEVQDRCNGHPERSGTYHYHNLPSCLDDVAAGHSRLMGYAFDGFGIYGHRGPAGRTMTNVDLDECHGHTHEIEWDGRTVSMFHYHATWEYPYTIGCYRGAPVRSGPPPGGAAPPPPPQPYRY